MNTVTDRMNNIYVIFKALLIAQVVILLQNSSKIKYIMFNSES